MSLIASCLGRLGSRYSIILDPNEKKIHYGSLGMLCQEKAELIVGLDDGEGNFSTLPFTTTGKKFNMVDQHFTATSLIYDAYDNTHGVKFQTQIYAPFWPQDITTSIIPAYIFKFRIEPINRIRAYPYISNKNNQSANHWSYLKPFSVKRQGLLKFALKIPNSKYLGINSGNAKYHVPIEIKPLGNLQGDGNAFRTGRVRTAPNEGESIDAIIPLKGDWKNNDDFFEVSFDLDNHSLQEFSVAIASHTNGAFFERFSNKMQFKYTDIWDNIDEIIDYLKNNHNILCDKSKAFDCIWLKSSMPLCYQNIIATSFQNFLMNSIWASNKKKDWFSIWEGNCLLNSTVDVEYNNALFYFSCWPELLEIIFEEWSEHANTAEMEKSRKEDVKRNSLFISSPHSINYDYPGVILEHDMGAGWSSNGQSYQHAMPVEENANFLLMLYTHGKWWNREHLFQKYNALNKKLVEFLLWADSTGNGFPDRGTANTIDDGAAAVQYGKDNVYLGVKRLAALHAAQRMFEYTKEQQLAVTCKNEVSKAIKTLNNGFIEDHFPICLNKNAKDIKDVWTGKNLPYDELPGWDSYNIHTSNGLLYLMMVNDLPVELDKHLLTEDITNSFQHTISWYGCTHDGKDDFRSIWVSLNIWRDCIAGYLGLNFLYNAERYWNLQIFSNSSNADKINCFAETAQNNNLVYYPRAAASFGMAFATVGLTKSGSNAVCSDQPICEGKWPLLPLSNWETGEIYYAICKKENSKIKTEIISEKVNINDSHLNKHKPSNACFIDK